MKATITTIGLLILSNCFMTIAWYGHLKFFSRNTTPLFIIILFCWGLAFFEYCFQVPANRIGAIENGGPLNLMQLKVIQEVITLIVFFLFCQLFFKSIQFRWNHLVAFLLLIGAVYFVFKK
jgi:uncharacterized protein (DUF486 family)